MTKKAKTKTEKKIVKTQKYSFEITHYEGGEISMVRTNEGFSVLELLGITSLVQHDLMNLLSDVVKKPNEIIRTSIKSPIIH